VALLFLKMDSNAIFSKKTLQFYEKITLPFSVLIPFSHRNYGE
jgi:hypothetical protein